MAAFKCAAAALDYAGALMPSLEFSSPLRTLRPMAWLSHNSLRGLGVSVAQAVALAAEPLDVAHFARVVTWDPNRTNGCQSSRIEEFAASDLFLESTVLRDADGSYPVPVARNGIGCIGLQWLNRRSLTEVGVELADGVPAPPADSFQVQGWFGESGWQGTWQPLAGIQLSQGNRLSLRLQTQGETATREPRQMQKIRWVFPPLARPGKVRSLWALTSGSWETMRLSVQMDPKRVKDRRSNGAVRVFNGQFVGAVPERWRLSEPLMATVKYALPSASKADATVLWIQLPGGSVAVAIEDILNHECVHLPSLGVFVVREPAPVKLAEYQARIAHRKTLLEEVRERPDQTREQAMSRTHHAAQEEGPVMLSLACDNSKWVVERDGAVRFQPSPSPQPDWSANAAELRPVLVGGAAGRRTRQLVGGWLPAPVITLEAGGTTLTERALVVPCDEAGSDPARLSRPSVCALEFTLASATPSSAPLPFSLALRLGRSASGTVTLDPRAGGSVLAQGGLPFALILSQESATLRQTNAEFLIEFARPAMTTPRAHYLVYLLTPEVSPAVASGLPAWERLQAQVEAYWTAVLAPAMQVETPDPWLNHLIRSSQVRCLIAARNEADGARIAPWIAAMSYGPLESEAHSVIRGMDLMGHTQFAQRGLDFFIHQYSAAGYLTTGYTLFGTAWHLWTVGEHVELAACDDWLRQVAPDLTRTGEWIVRQTEKTKRIDPEGVPTPEYGLMPPGVLADWNAFAYHFCLNAYYYAALRELGGALARLEDPRGALFAARASELRANILRAYHWTQAQSPALPLSNGAWIAAYPSQLHSPGQLGDFFPGQDAGRSWCYDVELGAHQIVPAGVIDPNGA